MSFGDLILKIETDPNPERYYRQLEKLLASGFNPDHLVYDLNLDSLGLSILRNNTRLFNIIVKYKTRFDNIVHVPKGDSIDHKDMTYLILASYVGNVHMVETLLNLGCGDINLRAYRVGSALSIAIRKRYKAIEYLLKSRGANLDDESLIECEEFSLISNPELFDISDEEE